MRSAMAPRSVYLVQVNWSNCAGNSPGYWVPYSVGSLWAYAATLPAISSNYVLQDIIFERQSIEPTADAMKVPDVVGFSTYVWNEQYNFKLAKAIRTRWPEALIVFGGPQVPNRADGYFKAHSYIDILVHSEGELSFSDLLLQRLKDQPDYLSIPGCSVNCSGDAVRTPTSSRITGLNKLPSPYLSGTFDTIFAMHPSADWNAVIENNRGCPYQCSFCDWGTLTYSKIFNFPIDRVLAEIEWLAEHRVNYVMPADANFGIFADRDQEIAAQFVNCRSRHGYPRVVGMAFAKNSNRRIAAIAKTLHDAGLLKALTLSVQSMSKPVLDAIKRRNMAVSDFSALLGECNREGIPTYTELILGLPEETLTSWKEGLARALECGQHNQLESWLLEILENAPLNDPETIQRFGMKTARLKNYTFLYDKKTDEEAPEQISVVYETAAMPYADFQQALGFSMIIYNLHAYGWTQLVSRYLRTVHSIGYLEFYTQLEAWILSNSNSILHREYNMTVDTLREMVATGNYVVDRWLGDKNVGSVPIALRSQGFFHMEEDSTHAAVADFAAECFGELIGNDLPELLRFQRNFVVSASRTYPYEETFELDLALLLRDAVPVQRKVTYRFDTDYRFVSLGEYLELIYSKKKQGFGKAKVCYAHAPELRMCYA